MNDEKQQNIVDHAFAELTKHGVGVEPVVMAAPEPGGADMVVRLVGAGGKAQTYAIETKKYVTAATVGGIIHALEKWRNKDGRPTLLVAPYITPPLAERLREKNIEFVDTAGNAYLKQLDWMVWVKGQRPAQKPGVPETNRAFQPGGLKVIFALLCRPDMAGRPYRELAEAAGVAHGTAAGTITEATQLGFVARINGKRRLLQAEKLLRQWAEAYARTLRPKLVLARYQAEMLPTWETLPAEQYGMMLGGEMAAARITRRLHPATLTLFADKINPRFILDFRLRPHPQGNVEVLRRFWRFDTGYAGMAPLPLIFADLLAIGDARCVEAADQIYERIMENDEFIQ